MHISALRYIFLYFLLAVQINMHGQRPFNPGLSDPLNDKWRIKQVDELNPYGVHCIVSASDGTIWAGHSKGLMHYNGYNWKHIRFDSISMRGNFTRNILPTPHEIYLHKHEGLYLYKNKQWQAIIELNDILPVYFNCVRQLPGGAILVASTAGLIYLHNNTKIIYASGNNAATLKNLYPGFKIINQQPFLNQPDFRASTMVLTSDTTLKAFDEKNGIMEITLTGKPGNPVQVKPLNRYIRASNFSYSYIDQNDNLWFSCEFPLIESEIVCFSKEKEYYYNPLELFGVSNKTSDIVECHDGTILIGGEGSLYAIRNNKIERFSKPQLPIAEQTIKLAVDKYGNVWMASFGGKTYLIEYHKNRWKKYNNLAFQFENNEGVKWFIAKDSKIVFEENNNMYFYDTADGLIDAPTRIIQTSRGDIWCSGSHNNRAATAYLKNNKWHKQVHYNFAWSIEKKAVYESSDGSIWFGAKKNPNGLGGTLKLTYKSTDSLVFKHFYDPENSAIKLHNVYGGFFEDKTGQLYAASFYWLWKFDGSVWIQAHLFEGRGPVTSVVQSSNNQWLIGTAEKGFYVLSDTGYKQFNMNNGLLNNAVLSMAAFSPNAVWIATEEDFTFFDGHSCKNNLLSKEFLLLGNSGEIKVNKANNTLWINIIQKEWVYKANTREPSLDLLGDFYTINYKSDTSGPRTHIINYTRKVNFKSDNYIEWSAVDFWNMTPQSNLQFSYKLNDTEWTPFDYATGQNFQSLKPGNYTLRVRSLDTDLNVDRTPASIQFRVLPPIYFRTWFIVMLIFFLGLIIYLLTNIIKRNRLLAKLNLSLNKANKDLRFKNDEIEDQYKALQVSEEETFQLNEELKSVNEHLVNQQNELKTTLNNLKKAQLQLVQAEKMASVGMLTAGIAHELNNPLNFILGGNEAISELFNENQIVDINDANPFLNIIREGIERATGIIQSLNRFSRTNDDVLETCNINIIIENCLVMLNNKLKNKVIVNKYFAKTDTKVLGNEGRLHQAFLNILTNAEQAIAENGIIDIITEQDNLWIKTTINDNGCGIGKKEMKHITEPFFTTKPPGKGTGMGLSITSQIIQEHGGNITFNSKPGEGTSVIILLPLNNI